MTDGDRPQDVGRSHRRRGAPSAETAELLTTYQVAMRDELRGILAALKAAKPLGLVDVGPELAIPLEDPRRDRLWDRAVKLGRELGSAIDADPVPIRPTEGSAAAKPRPRRRKLDMG